MMHRRIIDKIIKIRTTFEKIFFDDLKEDYEKLKKN